MDVSFETSTSTRYFPRGAQRIRGDLHPLRPRRTARQTPVRRTLPPPYLPVLSRFIRYVVKLARLYPLIYPRCSLQKGAQRRQGGLRSHRPRS